MGVKIKTKKNKIPEMRKNLKALGGLKVQVGVMGEIAWLARIHEYGCKIQVTPKMRAFLHAKGLHLKDTTEYITIPERSFLRNGYAENKDEVLDIAKSVIGDVIHGYLSIDEYGNIVGDELASRIQDYATDLSSPANHPFTVQQKGSNNPLNDTGQMIDSIGYEVIKE